MKTLQHYLSVGKGILFMFLSLCLFSATVNAQNHNMGSGNLNSCTATLFDSGGNGGNYGNNELITETYCSNTPGQCLSVTFNSFNLESGFDELTIYDGANTSAPVIGVFSGTTSPGTITASGTCLTFVFDSDGSVTRAGWNASMNCTACPTCTDGIQNGSEVGVDCGGPSCPPCPGPHTLGNGNLNSCSATIFDSGGSGGNYGNNELITETYCSNVPGQCLSITFTAFNTESGFDELTIYDGSNTSAPVIGVFSGTTSPGTITASGTCLTFVFDSDGSVTRAGWVASMTCAACPTCTDGIQNGLELGVDCGGPTCPACPCSAFAVTNDEPCCAIPLTVNPTAVCTSVTAGSAAGSTSSMAGCTGTADDDVWFEFTAISPSQDITISNATGTTDMVHEVFSGNCNSLTSISCSDPNTSSLTGLTVGDTYYVRVYTWSSSGANTGFDICVTSPCGITSSAPDCGLNYSHTTIPHNPVNYNTGTALTFSDDRFADNFSNMGFDFCFDGVIYQQCLVSSNGYITFPGCFSSHDGNNATPGGYSPWSTSAAAPNSNDAPQNAIMVPWHDIDPGVSGTIRTQTVGTAPNRIFIVKFDDIAMFSASCNSLLFSAQVMLYETSNIIEIHITEKPVCTTWNGGAAILGLNSYDGSTAVVPSGYNYPTQWTVPAASPEAHRFTPSCGGTCDPLLSNALASFDGEALDNGNQLRWSTHAEEDISRFVIEKSTDAQTFTSLDLIQAVGSGSNQYEYFDEDNQSPVCYYRLGMLNMDGNLSYSQIIAIRRSSEAATSIRLYPNPASGSEVTLEIKGQQAVTDIRLTNYLGQQARAPFARQSSRHLTINTSALPKGTYIVEIQLDDSTTRYEKLILE